MKRKDFFKTLLGAAIAPSIVKAMPVGSDPVNGRVVGELDGATQYIPVREHGIFNQIPQVYRFEKPISVEVTSNHEGNSFVTLYYMDGRSVKLDCLMKNLNAI